MKIFLSCFVAVVSVSAPVWSEPTEMSAGISSGGTVKTEGKFSLDPAHVIDMVLDMLRRDVLVLLNPDEQQWITDRVRDVDGKRMAWVTTHQRYASGGCSADELKKALHSFIAEYELAKIQFDELENRARDKRKMLTQKHLSEYLGDLGVPPLGCLCEAK